MEKPETLVVVKEPKMPQPIRVNGNGSSASLNLLRHKRMLIVEDDEHYLELYRLWMERAGCLPWLASSPEKAVGWINNSGSPHLVVLDLEFKGKGLSGIEFCRILKNHPMTQNTPVLVITAHTENTARLMCNQVGADSFLGKPIQEADCLQAMAQLLEEKNRPVTPLSKSNPANGNGGSNDNPFSTIISEEFLIEEPTEPLISGPISLNRRSHLAIVAGKLQVDLSQRPKLYKILVVLMLNEGKTVACGLLAEMTGDSPHASDDPRVVQRNIQRLRKLLGSIGAVCIKTMEGEGVRFVA